MKAGHVRLFGQIVVAALLAAGAVDAHPLVAAGNDRPRLLRLADEPDASLQQRIAKAEQLIRSKVTTKLTQNQFDGLVSFAISAPEAFDGPFLAAVNKGDFEAATTLMLGYDKVRDAKSGRMTADPALHARREAERNLILHGVYDAPQKIAGRSQDEPWSYHCDGDSCAISSEIRNDDAASLVAMRLDFIVDRKSKSLSEIRFTLPNQARGKTFALAFAKARTDERGQPHVDLVSGSTRVVTITDCGAKECQISLAKGLLAPAGDQQASDIGAQMRANSQMLVNYPSGKDYYRTSILLSGLQQREQQLLSGAVR